MSPDTLARWQFASTTVYHFLIVPISIGLALLVASMQTLAYRRRGPRVVRCGTGQAASGESCY